MEYFQALENILQNLNYLLFKNCLLYFALEVRESNSENFLDLIFAAPPCEKVMIVLDTNYITSAIRKLMLDMKNPGSFQNIGLLI